MAKVEAKGEIPKETKLTLNACTVCQEPIEYDESKPMSGFKCSKSPGKHVAVAKTYYHLGAAHVQNPRDRRLFAPLIVLSPGYESRDDRTGKIVGKKALMVQFAQSGTYTTADPEEQYYLDRKADILSGETGLKQWQKVYLTQDQQLKLARDEVAALEQRSRELREGNSLLEQVKRAAGA